MTSQTSGAALITGAASGIGRATVLHSVQRGYKVLAVDRDQNRLASLVEEVRELHSSVDITTAHVDVTDRNSLAAALTGTRGERDPLAA